MKIKFNSLFHYSQLPQTQFHSASYLFILSNEKQHLLWLIINQNNAIMPSLLFATQHNNIVNYYIIRAIGFGWMPPSLISAN